MTDEEKLAYARKHYVVGTKFMYKGYIRTVAQYNHKNGDSVYRMQGRDVWCDNGMYPNYDDGTNCDSNPYLYEKGVWKEIVSYPEGFVKDEVINTYSIF